MAACCQGETLYLSGSFFGLLFDLNQFDVKQLEVWKKLNGK
jgi:hypothetical protein